MQVSARREEENPSEGHQFVYPKLEIFPLLSLFLSADWKATRETKMTIKEWDRKEIKGKETKSHVPEGSVLTVREIEIEERNYI